MALSDVSIPQDGDQGNVKLHPYLITLVRWCVSCLWSTATVLLHRLVTAPLPPITAASKPPLAPPRARQAGTAHLHPEPTVECVVLHAPPAPTLDVIFVHGLYGSLGNTWRQGEWKTKYKHDPTKVLLRNHPTEPCSCTQNKPEHSYNNLQDIYEYETNLNETTLNETTLNENVSFDHLNGCFKKILPNENSLITEKFYNNTLIRVDVDNYETQAKFVTELFKTECDKNCDLNTFKCKFDENGLKCNCDDRSDIKCHSDNCKCNLNEMCKLNECKCKLNVAREGGCVAGCGCVCDECYSPCWPKDWIKEDFPGARVISINYTSDPYLWRPLWVKGNKRLRLHERAQQMSAQLVALGVGGRPIVWVGHSKGGLFIKQIYCDAYEAHLKMKNQQSYHQNITNKNSEDQSDREYNINNIVNNVDNKVNNYYNNEVHTKSLDQNSDKRNYLLNNFMNEQHKNGCTKNGETTLRNIDEMNEIRNNNNSGDNSFNVDFDNNCNNMINYSNDAMTNLLGCVKNDDVVNDTQARCNESSEYVDISVRKDEQRRYTADDTAGVEGGADDDVVSSNPEEDSLLPPLAALWWRSAGFMFYSVPHRGSPLADIKTPITCRSVELQEIAKDCPLVLQLQSRWLAACGGAGGPGPGACGGAGGPGPGACGGAGGPGAGARGGRRRPQVRSVVESVRTLMSLLWLRIVSEDSADAGIGSLHGVSVDHREICKPSSRTCMLYTELTELIQAALNTCDCQ